MPERLILIKHAKPLVNPSQLPELWELSSEGIEASNRLAGLLEPLGISSVYCSEEVKAIGTAHILAEHLKLAHQTVPDLHEHDRSNVPHMRSGEFISHMELFFRRPSERVLGRESAEEALQRFESAVRNLCEKDSGKAIAVVSHGTVISLLVARLTDRNPFELWRAMQLPSYLEIDTGNWTIKKLVEKI